MGGSEIKGHSCEEGHGKDKVDTRKNEEGNKVDSLIASLIVCNLVRTLIHQQEEGGNGMGNGENSCGRVGISLLHENGCVTMVGLKTTLSPTAIKVSVENSNSSPILENEGEASIKKWKRRATGVVSINIDARRVNNKCKYGRVDKMGR